MYLPALLLVSLTQNKTAKSEGGTPVGSPQKWMSEGEGMGRRESGGEGGEERAEQVLSSDDEAPITSVAHPRQRSIRQKRYILTNKHTSEQLVRFPEDIYLSVWSCDDEVTFDPIHYRLFHACSESEGKRGR